MAFVVELSEAVGDEFELGGLEGADVADLLDEAGAFPLVILEDIPGVGG